MQLCPRTYARLYIFLFLSFQLSFNCWASPELDLINSDISQLWSRFTPALTQMLTTQIQNGLIAIPAGTGDTQVSVKRIKQIRVEVNEPPGFSRLDHSEVAVSWPLNTGWSFYIDVDLHVVLRRHVITTITTSVDVPITARITGLQMQNAIQLNSVDPLRPQIVAVPAPVIQFKMTITSNNDVIQLALGAAKGFIQQAANQIVGKFKNDVTSRTQFLVGLPGPVLGDATGVSIDDHFPPPTEPLIMAIDGKIQKYHLPFGTLLQVVDAIAAPARESWVDAYGSTSAPSLDVQAFAGEADSAMWTGHLLAAESFQYQATHSPAVLTNLQNILAGVDLLLAVDNYSGLLVREVAPIKSAEGQRLLALGQGTKIVTLNGQTWVAYSGAGGISRDPYMGLIFGLGTAYDSVTDSSLKKDIARKIEILADYLLRTNWFIDEDRTKFGVSPLSTFPTFWFGEHVQKLAILKTAQHVNPSKYQSAYDQIVPLGKTAWFFTWLNTFDPGSYYKFNLDMISFYEYLRLESDATLRGGVMEGFQIMQNYLTPQKNPYFDLISISIDPQQKAVFSSRIKSELGALAARNHRWYVPPDLDFSHIEFVMDRLPTMNLGDSPSEGSPQNQYVRLPKDLLPMALRNINPDFEWQTSPFQLAIPGSGDPKIEITGLDLLLPYWMGRVYGVL